MTDKKKYKNWLAVVDGQVVQFSDLAHMMATALHPNGGMDYAAARINLDDELKLAVRDDLLRVRNPAGMGFHTFPHGAALQRAVLIPDTDLEPFLNERGIELRLTPHGNGPDYWTLENAAAAMQEQLSWHDGTRAEFQDQMQEAAAAGALVVLNPRTCLPYRPETVRTFWEYVTPDCVNTWLATLKAPYRWEVEATPAPLEPEQAASDAIDFAVLSSPAELIAAFGRFTGMDASWFDKWADYPALNNAIKVKGTSGRGRTTEPLFCPFLVMQGLMKKPRKGSNRKAFQSTEKPWELLKRHFPNVYATHQGLSPLDD